jgi:hypothetical protein
MGTARGAPAAAIALALCLAGCALAARGTLVPVLWCTRGVSIGRLALVSGESSWASSLG